MKLLASAEDYCLQKVKLALLLAGISCEIETGVAIEDLVKLDAGAKAMVMDTGAGFINKHDAILRYIAESQPSAKLWGSEELHRAMTDQWLEFSVQELGKVIQDDSICGFSL
jgi:hypothetical protein